MKNNAMKDNVIKARGKNYSEKTIKIVVNLAMFRWFNKLLKTFLKQIMFLS